MEIVYMPIPMRDIDHELRTPLTGILGLARLLQDLPQTSEYKSYVKGIISEGEKLVQLANVLNQSITVASQPMLTTRDVPKLKFF